MFKAAIVTLALATLALAAIAVPTLAQTVPADTTADYVDLSPNGTLPLLLPTSAHRPLAEVCHALETTLPIAAIADATATSTCAYSSELIFVLARFQHDGLSNIRFKLNSSPGDQSQDLLELRDMLAAFHEQLGWPAPTNFLTAVGSGRPFSCRAGSLQYELSRERGQVPRYNAMLRIETTPTPWPDTFRNAMQPCSR